jgi:hypothetical protein
MRWVLVVLMLGACAQPKPHIVYNYVHDGCMRECDSPDTSLCLQFCNCAAWEMSNIPSSELSRLQTDAMMGFPTKDDSLIVSVRLHCLKQALLYTAAAHQP